MKDEYDNFNETIGSKDCSIEIYELVLYIIEHHFSRYDKRILAEYLKV